MNLKGGDGLKYPYHPWVGQGPMLFSIKFWIYTQARGMATMCAGGAGNQM